MFRRRFMQKLALGSATALAGNPVAEAGVNKTVLYRVTGFTCITCAVGLETMLCREKGIAQVKASYPSGNVLIEFNPAVVTDKSLRGYIAEMGFHVQEERAR